MNTMTLLSDKAEEISEIIYNLTGDDYRRDEIEDSLRLDRDTAQALVFARSIVKRYWQWKSGCIYYCPTELMYIRTLLREFPRAEEKTLIDLE